MRIRMRPFLSTRFLPENASATETIETTAKEHVLARNRDGEYHLILFFDLKPCAEIQVKIGRREY
jgi:hypothetical protein